MRIEVTQEDIDDGQPGMATHCPIALAMGRATGKQWRVDGPHASECNWDGQAVRGTRIVLPSLCVQFVKDFDGEDFDLGECGTLGPECEPFSFDLELPA